MSTALILREEAHALDLQQEALPALFLPDTKAAERFMGFFAVHIRNPNTRRAYSRVEGLQNRA